jgi:tripartite-type tricarboxylate transporter receptor subunit TctC
MTTRKLFLIFTGLLIGLGSVGIPRTGHSQPYYKGKSITMILGSAPGGRRDRISRTTARFLSKYIPGNPNILVQNIPGGKGIPGQLRFSRGKTDGTVLGLVVSSDMEAPYFGTPGANYNPRDYVWVGAIGTGKQRNVLYTHKRAGFNSLKEVRTREIAIGAINVGHRSYLYSRLMTEILGLNVRWVLGYSTPELYIAIERGEVDGRVNDSASMFRDRPDWFDKREVVAHVAMTLPKNLPPIDHPVVAKVPSIMQFAKTETHREIIKKINSTDRLGGAFAFPPGTPDRFRKIMEKALLNAAKDPQFRRLWEIEVGIRPFQGAFDTANVEAAVRLYTDWKPEVLKSYKRLGYQPPK